MKRFVLFILLVAGLSHSATVTLSGSRGSCAYGAIATDGQGNLSVTCAGTVTVDPVPPNIPAVSCPQSATYSGTFVTNAQKLVFPLAYGQSAAVAFTPRAGQSIQLSTSETTSTPQDAFVTVTVSECPNDFYKSSPCKFDANYVGSTLNAYAGSGGPVWACKLDPGKTYYMNVGMNVCATSCPVRLQIQGYQ